MKNRIYGWICFVTCFFGAMVLYHEIIVLTIRYMLPNTNLFFVGIIPLLITLSFCFYRPEIQSRILRNVCYFPLLEGLFFYIIFMLIGENNGSQEKIKVFFLGFLLMALCLGMAMLVNNSTNYMKNSNKFVRYISCFVIFLATKWIYTWF